MCKVFNCELNEIIEYVPDEAVFEKNNMLNLKIASDFSSIRRCRAYKKWNNVYY
ncbi:MAG: hypothetical protein LRZ93_03065 [Clostridiales bacterium]|nr:hypothetical protein [Clostridiales bacterium]